jgi:hypothetical protein
MSTTNRVILYMTSFNNLAPLVTSAQDGVLTHVLVGLLHLGYDNETNKTGPYVHLNNIPPDDPSLDNLWSTLKSIQGPNFKVMASLGGGGVGDYGNLFSNYSVFYPMLADTLTTYNFDGLDLDIEEWGVTTANVQQLVGDLRKTFQNRPGGFLISSAPVASALTGGGSVSADVNYNQLLDQFDWYNLQFYNGWGDLQNGSSSAPPNYNPNYAGVVTACGSTNVGRLVAGALTNPNSGGGFIGLSTLCPIISSISESYPGFGGVFGWNYQNALDTDGRIDPLGWAESISGALNTSSENVGAGHGTA